MIYVPEQKLWWPDDEDPARCYGYMLNRVTDIDVAVKRVQTRGLCVQAGGFIGIWPRRLAKYFAHVRTFEPVPHLYDCLEKNTDPYPEVIPANLALGAEVGTLHMSVRHSGCSRVADVGVPVTQVTIDSLHLSRCDALFLDLEGHELQALAGAAETIRKFKPVIVVEAWPKQHDALWKWITENKYEQDAAVHGDWVLVPPRKK